MRWLRKYLKTFEMGFQTALEYRINFALSLVSAAYPILIQTFLWTAIYKSTAQEVVYGYTFRQIIAYTQRHSLQQLAQRVRAFALETLGIDLLLVNDADGIHDHETVLDARVGRDGSDRRERRHQPERHCYAVFFRHFLKRLGRDYQTNPEQDTDHRFHRHNLENQGNSADQAEDRDHRAVQYRVTPPRPHGLPPRMTDVDRGRERVPQARRDNRTEPVDQQGRPCIVTVAGCFRTFKILQRTDHVERR